MMTINNIANWFIDKNFSQQQAQAINHGSSYTVEKETEKAVFVKIDTDFGTMKSWIPKSVINVQEKKVSLWEMHYSKIVRWANNNRTILVEMGLAKFNQFSNKHLRVEKANQQSIMNLYFESKK